MAKNASTALEARELDTNSLNEMYSAASFASLLAAPSSQVPPKRSTGRPPIVSFYGFKGGAGRSMAMVHVAALLARKGFRIGAVDMDFEAPGLHSLFGCKGQVSKGALEILEDGNYLDRPLDMLSSLLAVEMDASGTVLLLPAGRLDENYLRRMDQLRPLLWDTYDQRPLTRFFDGFSELQLDALLIDCRTGFHGVTGSVLFHYSDLIVCFLPLSEQVWDGVTILAKAWRQARQVRGIAPGILLVPSMVPTLPESKGRLDKFNERLGDLFRLDADDSEFDLEDRILTSGISYHPGLALDGKLARKFVPAGPWIQYEALTDRVGAVLGAGPSGPTERGMDLSAEDVLKEIRFEAKDAFAEELEESDIQTLLVPTMDARMALAPTVNLVVGAKGAGKTLLWRCCVKRYDVLPRMDGYEYLVGLAPREALDHSGLHLSAAKLSEIYTKAKMEDKENAKAFWILYALRRLAKTYPYEVDTILEPALRGMKTALRAYLVDGEGLEKLLARDEISTTTEDLLKAADANLHANGKRIVLCYDGLDVGFYGAKGKNDDWVRRREVFVTGLLQLLIETRGMLHALHLKVFLREDIFLAVEGLQNKSHLEAFKRKIEFKPEDLWRLALNLVAREGTGSRRYRELLEHRGIRAPWEVDEARLREALEPLWGQTLETGNAVRTANFIVKRTSDGADRLFPRTFVQLLNAAISQARKMDPQPDRILPRQALKAGVELASLQRSNDLKTEYVELVPYLDAMEGMSERVSFDKLKNHLAPKVRNHPGANLHKGSPGWKSVARRLVEVGVLSELGGKDETIYTVALMYRKGLKITARGY